MPARATTAVLALLLALVCLVALAPPSASSDDAAPDALAPPDAGAAAVEVADEVDATAGPDDISALRRVGGRLEVLEATVADGEEALAFTDAAARGAELIAVEVDVDFRPDADPLRDQQWNLDMVGLERAAERADGSGVVVAVLDTCIAGGHRELSGRLVRGWDFVSSPPGPLTPADRSCADGDGNHGTHVAGIIAAATGNGFGIHGAAPGAAVMPVRVITASGGNSSSVAAGIIWAVDNGADVVNLSLSSPSESVLVRAAVDYAVSRRVVVVASAGNLGADGSPVVWPAAYPEVVAVGAVAAGGELWTASNRGDYVDVVAPGVAVVSLHRTDDQYLRMTGTSQAAPHVAALAAMMLSVDPALTPARIQAIVQATATDGGPVGFDTGFGHGVIDAVEAVAAAAPGTPTPPARVWAVERGADGLRLRWEHADNSRLGYEVLRDGTVIASLGRQARDHAIARPDPGTAPVYQVRSTGPNGSRSRAVGLVPAPPGLTATPAVGTVMLSWPGDRAATDYVLLRDGVVLTTVANAIDAGGRVTFVDSAVTAGRPYRYQVAARESNGLSGVRSLPVVGTPRHPPPVAVGEVTASAVRNTVQLSWPAATGPVTRYAIERGGTRLADAGTSLTWTDVAPPGGLVTYRVVAIGPGGESAYPDVSVETSAPTTGYRIVTDQGRVLAYGDAAAVGDGAPTGDVVAGAATPTGDGYWLAHADGTVEAFGAAVWLGDVRDLPLEAPIVAMAALPGGGGYWLLAGDGGVFTFGDAQFFGSTGGLPLVAPVIDLAISPTGQGYWFVASDGGVFTFGDAVFRGSTGGWPLDAPVVSMAAGPSGYWLIAADGGVFAFGTEFYGSLPGTLTDVPADQRPRVVRMRPVNAGRGYLLLADDGGIFGYGRHSTFGSAHAALGAGERVVDLLVS